ncbi:sugar-binding transcriptional regulator [Actinomyces provencensis]|uniref:sugar-binding transcriptional regulator n=1 Tax=Actinomyces provencensis TaxID=1720198 RepID=UPI00096A83C8|nr:sugar-binding transcriptional regulator [Actinomyces provencensis]
MANGKDARALEAARLYYIKGLSQSVVAKSLGVSRPTASKLIQYARDRGFVTISINDPGEDRAALEDRLRETFDLEGVGISSAVGRDYEALLDGLGAVGAELVEDLVHDGTMIGVSWGKTMWSVARHLGHRDVHGVEVIQLKGGLSFTSWETNDMETMNLFCRAFNAYGRYLHLPVAFDSEEVKRLVESERHLRRILDMGREADLAVFTVGSVEPDSLLLSAGYLTPEEHAEVLARAEGDICSRFFDSEGNACVPSLDRRTVGISLEDLRRKPRRVLVAGGRRKLNALESALRAGYATHLVTDEVSAQVLLERATSSDGSRPEREQL